MDEPVKLIALLRSGPAAGVWQDLVASALATGVRGLNRLVFNTVSPIDVRTGEDRPPPFVAVVEGWFADRHAAEAFAATLRLHGEAVHLFVAPLLIHDGGRRPLPNKIMVTMKRLPGLSREQAQRHWRTRHVEVGLIEHNAGDFLQLYFQNHVIATDQPPGSATDYDGMPEFWVDPADLAAVGADSPVMRAIAEDETHFADGSSIITMLVSEQELFVAPDEEGGWPVRESPLAEVWRH